MGFFRNYLSFAYLGTVLEYYDYILFMQLSYFISQIFFPEHFNSMFYLFSIGYAARFFGVFVISLIKNDMERVLKLSLLLISVSSLIISIMPTYASIGLTATYLLIALRLLQGVSYAVEFPAAITVASGSSSQVGMVISSATVGSILANLSPWILLYFFSTQQILNFYWRIPFMISGLLGLLLLKLRSVNYASIVGMQRSISEFNLFTHARGMFNSVNTLLFPSFLIVFYMCLPQFFTKYGYKDLYFIYKYKLIMFAFSILCVSLIGKFMDSNNRTAFDSNNILGWHRVFVILWAVVLPFSLFSKFGAVLLMVFIQFCIAFSFHHGLRNMHLQCKGSVFASIVAYNLSMFIGSFASVFVSFLYMMIIPLGLGSLFAFQIHNNQRNNSKIEL